MSVSTLGWLLAAALAGQPSMAVTSVQAGADGPSAAAPAVEAPAAGAPAGTGSAVPVAKATPAAPRPPDLPADIPSNHWAAQVVLRALRQSIVATGGKGRFFGESSARRGELVHGLARVLELRHLRLAAAPANTAPRDMAATDREHDNAMQLIHAGLITARHGAIQAHDLLTREDMAMAASRTIALILHDGGAPVDTPVEINDVAPDIPLYGAVERCVKYKMISLQQAKFFSYLPITRYQLAAILIRLLDLK